jgi:aspartate aminotransferase
MKFAVIHPSSLIPHPSNQNLMPTLAERLLQMPTSATVALTDKGKLLEAQGRQIIPLAGGDPDFATPQHIIDTAVSAIAAGHTNYPAPSKGIIPLLEAIAAKTEADSGIAVNPASDIVVTPGGKWGLVLALGSVLNPGDEVLYLEPVWVSYVPIIQLLGGIPVPVSLPPEDNFTITAPLLEAKITPRTKALMLNSPNNPTGRVLTQAEAQAIATVAQKHDLFVVYDELYEKLLFDGRQHIALMGLPGMAERTLTVNGLSKSYAMTGWRLGWLVGPTAVMKLAAKMHSHTVTAAAHFTMYAAISALTGPQEPIAIMREAYQKRRDFMVKALNELPGITCASIEGAFYLFPRFTQTERTSVEIADALLELAGIASTPGTAFGSSGEKHIRFSIATSDANLDTAVARLATIIHQL